MSLILLRFIAALRSLTASLLAIFPLWAAGASPSLDLTVELDPASRHFKAVALVLPESRDFRFELHEALAIEAASIGGKALLIRAIGRRGNIRQWRIVLPDSEEALRLEYGGTLPVLDRNLDHRGVLQGLPPMAAPEGSFLPAGSAWYPQPAALFPYRLSLSVPSDQRALVPGRLVEESHLTESSKHYRASFEFPYPIDGIDLMAGPWLIREKMMGRADGPPIRLRTYFSQELETMPGLADAYLDDCQRYLERYGEAIGAYPFTEFSVVASPLPTGFGMPTLTYLGADILRLPFIRATSLGHEILHNWWGNSVYVDYTRGNWSEGLTTFMADYAYKEDESPIAAREMRQSWLRDLAALPAGTGQPLATFRSRTHGAAAAVGYGKGAMVFSMLRDRIGPEAFRQGIQIFWKQQRFRRASWDQLQQAFEQASGRSLGRFFDQWLNRADAPRANIVQASARPSASGKTQLTIGLTQSAPAYDLQLPLQIVFRDHGEIRWIDLQKQADRVSLEVDGQPEGIRLDPDLRVWRQLDREQLPPILRQWIIAAHPRLVQASRDGTVQEAVTALAGRLFESPSRAIPELDNGSDPTLLSGLHADVDAALARAGLPPRPPALAERGSAQVWTLARATGGSLAIVSARDASSLRALLRPLPHYGSQSWLVFDGSRALEKGIWPAPGPMIPIELER